MQLYVSGAGGLGLTVRAGAALERPTCHTSPSRRGGCEQPPLPVAWQPLAARAHGPCPTRLPRPDTRVARPPARLVPQRQKLQDVQAHVKVLEQAYRQQADVNGRLQAKVKSGAWAACRGGEPVRGRAGGIVARRQAAGHWQMKCTVLCRRVLEQ